MTHDQYAPLGGLLLWHKVVEVEQVLFHLLRRVILYFRSLAIGTRHGYQLYSLGSIDELDLVQSNCK